MSVWAQVPVAFSVLITLVRYNAHVSFLAGFTLAFLHTLKHTVTASTGLVQPLCAHWLTQRATAMRRVATKMPAPGAVLLLLTSALASLAVAQRSPDYTWRQGRVRRRAWQ